MYKVLHGCSKISCYSSIFSFSSYFSFSPSFTPPISIKLIGNSTSIKPTIMEEEKGVMDMEFSEIPGSRSQKVGKGGRGKEK